MIASNLQSDSSLNTKRMQVKGKALLSIPIFIYKKFGKKKYCQWLDSLSMEAKQVFSKLIDKDEWYSLNEFLVEPTEKLCAMFYNDSLRGAWDCGRYSAEYGLKGIYKILVKLNSPHTLIKKADTILLSYYKPCKMQIVESSKNSVVIHITEFPEIHKVIEYRIGGWVERAIEITGCKHVTVNITKSLTESAQVSEFRLNWKTGFEQAQSFTSFRVGKLFPGLRAEINED